MSRHYCTFCGSKRNISNLVKIEYPLLQKTSFHCRSHLSASADLYKIQSYNGINELCSIELFSGSGHVSEILKESGFDTFKLDFNSKFETDLNIDILKVRLNQLPRKAKFLWASIPCTTYSIAGLHKHWKKIEYAYRRYSYFPISDQAKQSIAILNKKLWIIKNLKGLDGYVIENPRGALRHMPQMEFIPYRYTVSYNHYGFEYYKHTDLWSNIPDLVSKQIEGVNGRKFKQQVQELESPYHRSLIPTELIKEIVTNYKRFVI